MNLLIIDGGHAEKVAGKSNPKENFYEWKFNFDMCTKVSKRCKEHDIYVYLTNSKPHGIDEMGLSKRAELANAYWKSNGKPKAMFMSVHGNAYSNPDARGTETYHASNASTTSKNFAKTLNDEIYATFRSLDSNAKNRGVKSSNFTVIYKAAMPAVLVEYGFYSNLSDLKILKNNQDELVEATVRAVCKYFEVAYKYPIVHVPQEFKNGDYGGKKAIVTATTLNIRRDRGTNYDVIGKLNKGVIVELEYCLNGWISIKGFKGNKGLGYISTEYLELI